MNLLKGLGLVGVGYFLSNKYVLTRLHQYKPYNPNQISYSDYFHELVINKLDILFYGGEVHSNKRNRVNYDYKPAYRYRYSPYSKALVEMIFKTKGEAEQVLSILEEIIEKYGKATIADYEDCCGLTSQFIDNRFGWTSLNNTKVQKTKDGYFIDFPKPIYLE